MLTWKCSRCLKIFYVEELYDKHLKKYGEKCPRIKCQDCGKVFRRELDFKRHDDHCPADVIRCYICQDNIHRSEYNEHKVNCRPSTISLLFGKSDKKKKKKKSSGYRYKYGYTNNAYRGSSYNYNTYGTYGTYAGNNTLFY